MRLSVWLAVALSACTPPTPSDPAPDPLAPEALSGSYHIDHEVGVFDGTDFVLQPTTDRLALVPAGDSLDVSLVLIHTNAHICEMHTRLGREGSVWVARESIDLSDDESVCTVSVRVESDTLRLHDLDNQCRRAYCGARGSINGAAFPQASREADTSWRDDLR